MRVLQLESSGDLRVAARPRPAVGLDQVLLAIEWGGVCGSDTAYWRSGASGSAKQRHPFVLGHEVSGRVLEVGDAVHDVEVGAAATVHPARVHGALPERLTGRDNLHPDLTYLGSAARDPHTDGGFAEQLLVERHQVRLLPKGLPTRRAVLAEPLAVALHALTRVGDVRGASVIVSGCGPVGALAIVALKAAGAVRITAIDPSPVARALAADLGASSVLDIGEPVEGVHEYAFEASGSPASLAVLLRTVAVGGTIVQIGNLPLEPVSAPLGLLVSRELQYLGAYRFVDEIDDAIALLASEPALERVITHEFALEDAEAAFTAAVDRSSSCKVLLRFDRA